MEYLLIASAAMLLGYIIRGIVADHQNNKILSDQNVCFDIIAKEKKDLRIKVGDYLDQINDLKGLIKRKNYENDQLRIEIARKNELINKLNKPANQKSIDKISKLRLIK